MIQSIEYKVQRSGLTKYPQLLERKIFARSVESLLQVPPFPPRVSRASPEAGR